MPDPTVSSLLKKHQWNDSLRNDERKRAGVHLRLSHPLRRFHRNPYHQCPTRRLRRGNDVTYAHLNHTNKIPRDLRKAKLTSTHAHSNENEQNLSVQCSSKWG